MELSGLRGMGPVRIRNLRAMGISSLRDLLFFLPLRYEDHTHPTPLSEAGEGEVLVEGILREAPGISYYQGRSRVTATLWEGGRSLALCWFNEPWIRPQLQVGKPIRLYGVLRMNNHRRTMYNARIIQEAGFAPVYRRIPGLPAKTLRQMMGEALSRAEEICPETLPFSLRQKWDLPGLAESLRTLHQPESPEGIRHARRRLEFEEMLMYMMGVSLFHQADQPGWAMGFPPGATDAFWEKIPFPPTGAQKRVLEEIAADLRKDRAMSRLVQGDVGCGKTVLAFGSIFLARGQGFQSAMMAPTEILAAQHYENARRTLEPLGFRCALLTGSTRAAERRKILRALEDGSCDAVFGTHALIGDQVRFHRLGLVITDEQHRFGVRQRSALQMRGGDEGRAPHVLVMSATPIPRTLALILYGDLDLSIVDEVPPGRKPVRTRIVPLEKRDAMYGFLREEVLKGRQAYVVCPLAEDSEEMPGVFSADSLYEELKSRLLPGLRIGLTWGGQKSEKKTETLRKFSEGELDVLAATTVIEVGVNVPNATVMIIENAERYGLSQLHQLRGRVGRGQEESWCFLRSEAAGKLRILCETGDGFEVARKDLEMRGPGDLMGTRQSGEGGGRFPAGADARILDEAQQCVRELMLDPAWEEERAAVEALARARFDEQDFRIALN